MAELYAHAGQLLSWRRPDGDDVLFLSARDDRRQETHGGIPVIFPQFGATGPLPKHGFARDSEWGIGTRGVENGEAVGRLHLRPTPEQRALWPHDFAVELVVSLGTALTMTFVVENRGADPLTFSGGLHSYLRVSDLAAVRIQGLAGRRYRDNLRQWEEHAEATPELAVNDEIDRVYLGGPGTVVVRDDARSVTVESEGFANFVVWNPGPAGDAKFDFAPGEWRRFVCIEPMTVFEPVTVPPGGRWTGAQRISVA
jgi:glucose-6-phosphate 1-epimerase